MSTQGLTTSDGINLNELYYDKVIPLMDRYNKEDVTDFRAILCADDDETVKVYDLPEASRFQKVGEDFEQPDARKLVQGQWQFFSELYADSFEYTEAKLRQTSARQIMQNTIALLERDRLTQRYHILRGIVNSGADANSLWNGAFATNEGLSAPPAYGANTFVAGHNHYSGNNNPSGTIQLEDITFMKKHINEHGAQGSFVGFINSKDNMDLMNLSNFRYGGEKGKVSNPITDKVMVDGYVDRIFGIDIIETEAMPAGYMMIGKFNDNDIGKVCSFIQPTQVGWRGLRIIRGNRQVDYPLIGATAERLFKVAVRNRGNAFCMQFVSGSDVYTAPSAYSSAQ